MDTKYKIVISFVAIFLLFGLFAKKAFGQNVAGDSALIAKNEATSCTAMPPSQMVKKMAMQNVLERYNSPLLPYVEDFLSTCSKYNMDCYLIPAISGLESGFGKHLLPNSYNAWGFGGGYIVFDSWPHAIDRVGSTLKNNYIDRGADTVEKIAPIYAESKTWAPRVNFFLSQFQAEEEKIELFLNKNQVEL